MDKFYLDELLSSLTSDDNINFLLKWLADSGIKLGIAAREKGKKKLRELAKYFVAELSNYPENNTELISFRDNINELLYKEFIVYISENFPEVKVTIIAKPFNDVLKKPDVIESFTSDESPKLSSSIKIISEEELKRLMAKPASTLSHNNILDYLSNPLILSMFVNLVDNFRTAHKNTEANGVYSLESAMKKVKDEGYRVEKIVNKKELDKLIAIMNEHSDSDSNDSEEEVVVRKPKKKMEDNEVEEPEDDKDKKPDKKWIKQREVKARKPVTEKIHAGERSAISSRNKPTEIKQPIVAVKSNDPFARTNRGSKNMVKTETPAVSVKTPNRRIPTKQNEFSTSQIAVSPNVKNEVVTKPEPVKQPVKIIPKHVAQKSPKIEEPQNDHHEMRYSDVYQDNQDVSFRDNGEVKKSKSVPMIKQPVVVEKVYDDDPESEEEETELDKFIDNIDVSSDEEMVENDPDDLDVDIDEMEEEIVEEDGYGKELDIINSNINLENVTIGNLNEIKEELERLALLKKQFSNDESIIDEIDDQIAKITLALSSLKQKTKTNILNNKESAKSVQQASESEIFDLEFDPKDIDPKKIYLTFSINKKVINLTLEKYYLPSSKNNINKFNNKFCVFYAGRIHNCLIPHGNYNSLEPIISAIKNELKFIVIDIIDHKLSIKVENNVNFDLVMNDCSVFNLFGFTKNNQSIYKNKFCYVSDSKINLINSSKVYLSISNFVENFELQTDEDVEITHQIKSSSASILIRQLAFRFTFANGQPYDFPEKFRICFKAFYAK